MSKETKEVAVAGKTGVEALLSEAVAKGASVDTLERLLTMRRELKAEHAKESFVAAMAQFQADYPAIKKAKVVKNKDQSVRYKYAPLEQIVSQVKATIKDNGFSYMVNAVVEETGVTATVRVTHSEGHSIESSFKVPTDKESFMNAPQKVAAALTFAKRYAFCNAFGILTGDEDNDAAGTPPDAEKEKAPDEAVKKLRAQKTLATLNITWKGLTPKQRMEPEIRKVASEMKRKFS